MPEPRDEQRDHGHQELSDDRRQPEHLHGERERDEVDRERRQVDDLEPPEVTPHVPTHPEDEAPVEHERAEHRRDVGSHKGRHVAPVPTDRQLEQCEPAHADDRVCPAHDQEGHTLVANEPEEEAGIPGHAGGRDGQGCRAQSVGVHAPTIFGDVTGTPASTEATTHRLSVVIPVYQGEHTLGAVVDELAHYTQPFETPDGHTAVVSEVLLVHDHGPDGSPETMRALTEQYDWVRALWLSRNFGQHPATLAGMASSGGDWIVTMDEDGQHDPAAIGSLLDVAMSTGRAVVYADPTNAAPHSTWRNLASKASKLLIELLLGGTDTTKYQSFRLVLGEFGRSTAAFAGSGVFLDVALGWVAGEPATAPVALRREHGRASGYSARRLLSHFWRMVLSSGTRGLRAVSFLGAIFSVAGLLLAIILVVQRLVDAGTPAGWTSTIVVVLVTSGAVLFSLGVIAEYLGVAVNMAMGKPAYLLVSDPAAGPLGRRRRSAP